MVAPPRAESSEYFGMRGCEKRSVTCLCVCPCVCVCLQSTRGEGESAEGAALTPYRPPANPPGRVK